MPQTRKKPVLLVVDDDSEDIYLTRRAFHNCDYDLVLNSVFDGNQMFDYLNNRRDFTDPKECPIPDVILLDINIPKENGFEILKKLRADAQFSHLPVVMLTTSAATHDIRKAYQVGANSFICKSESAQGMQNVANNFCQYWFSFAKLPVAC